VFGRKANSTIDLEIDEEANSRGISSGEAKLLISDHVRLMRERAADVLVRNQQHGEIWANKHRKEPPLYRLGEVVWLKTPWKLDEGAKRKLAAKWRGPYLVTKVLPPVNLQVKPVGSMGSMEKASTVHLDRVKPFKMRDMPKEPVEDVSEGVPEEIVYSHKANDMKQYEVEEVIGHRWMNGKLEFSLRWKGFVEATWEPENQMQCRALVVSAQSSHNCLKLLNKLLYTSCWGGFRITSFEESPTHLQM